MGTDHFSSSAWTSVGCGAWLVLMRLAVWGFLEFRLGLLLGVGRGRVLEVSSYSPCGTAG